jgi:hypothetical protein
LGVPFRPVSTLEFDKKSGAKEIPILDFLICKKKGFISTFFLFSFVSQNEENVF